MNLTTEVISTVRFSCGGRHDGTGRRQLQAEVSKAFDARLAHARQLPPPDPAAVLAQPTSPTNLAAHSVLDAQIVEAASMPNVPAAPRRRGEDPMLGLLAPRSEFTTVCMSWWSEWPERPLPHRR